MKKLIRALKRYMKEYNKMHAEWMRSPGYIYQAAQLNAMAHGIAAY